MAQSSGSGNACFIRLVDAGGGRTTRRAFWLPAPADGALLKEMVCAEFGLNQHVASMALQPVSSDSSNPEAPIILPVHPLYLKAGHEYQLRVHDSTSIGTASGHAVPHTQPISHAAGPTAVHADGSWASTAAAAAAAAAAAVVSIAPAATSSAVLTAPAVRQWVPSAMPMYTGGLSGSAASTTAVHRPHTYMNGHVTAHAEHALTPGPALADNHVQALYDYEQKTSAELGFRVGDIIQVLSKYSEGWWKGQLTRPDGSVATGYFPTNYVRGGELVNLPEPKEDPMQDREYFDSYNTILIHHQMLLDEPRTLAYRTAVRNLQSIIQGKVVMDVGCGSGVLSIFCAQVGAKHVFAVDASDFIRNAAKVTYPINLRRVLSTVVHPAYALSNTHVTGTCVLTSGGGGEWLQGPHHHAEGQGGGDSAAGRTHSRGYHHQRVDGHLHDLRVHDRLRAGGSTALPGARDWCSPAEPFIAVPRARVRGQIL